MAVDVMEVDAIIADSVITAEGKLYVQGGGWDTIGSATFPFRQPRIGIGVPLRIPWNRTNEMHTLSLRIVDQDENKIALGEAPPGSDAPDGKVREIKGQFNLGRPPFLSVGDSQIVPIAMNLDGIDSRARYVLCRDLHRRPRQAPFPDPRQVHHANAWHGNHSAASTQRIGWVTD